MPDAPNVADVKPNTGVVAAAPADAGTVPAPSNQAPAEKPPELQKAPEPKADQANPPGDKASPSPSDSSPSIPYWRFKEVLAEKKRLEQEIAQRNVPQQPWQYPQPPLQYPQQPYPQSPYSPHHDQSQEQDPISEKLANLERQQALVSAQLQARQMYESIQRAKQDHPVFSDPKLAKIADRAIYAGVVNNPHSLSIDSIVSEVADEMGVLVRTREQEYVAKKQEVARTVPIGVGVGGSAPGGSAPPAPPRSIEEFRESLKRKLLEATSASSE